MSATRHHTHHLGRKKAENMKTVNGGKKDDVNTSLWESGIRNTL